ncbi:hydroxysteroid 11-beta-dehydrogenase 1-like protein [Varanus komodoensis]|uniref:hydroxysteroid 11-beta-dehydrogenase 1-like protein n=1 Tax=Varanus komodoensis TaxID=61221 RepID=UPI001CF7C31E|nr:hydroxysteroid 11-beta-dehydrogenase 1-like protein [Varanus komodoensis]
MRSMFICPAFLHLLVVEKHHSKKHSVTFVQVWAKMWILPKVLCGVAIVVGYVAFLGKTPLTQVMEKFLKLGAKKVFCFPADMASPEEPKKLVQFTLEHLGGLDYVVLNHIGWIPFAVWDGDVDHIRGLMQVNFLSYVTSAAAALPALTESKGSLLVVSSLLERIATPFMTTYSATKFALEGFFGSFCHELAMKKKDVSMTLYILGLTDMELSLNKTRDVTLTAAPASKAALAIVKGGSTRAREVFYPWTIQMLCWI